MGKELVLVEEKDFHVIVFCSSIRFGVSRQPIYINLIRKPLDRLVSYYYFVRYGDDLRPNHIRRRMGDKMVRPCKVCREHVVESKITHKLGTFLLSMLLIIMCFHTFVLASSALHNSMFLYARF